MKKSTLLIFILFASWWTGCSDDDSGGGPGTPAPDTCFNVGGTWSIAMEIDSNWFGGVLPLIAELAQSDTCTVTGTILFQDLVIEGYTTRDSFYFHYGEAGAAPQERVYCSLAVIDKYLMEGEYVAPDGSGSMTIHGPDPDCGGSVEIQVSQGLTPTFTWQPDCPVSFMLIESAGGGSDQWMVGNENANDLESGVVYGVAPPGVNSDAATPLVAGQTYHVILYYWLGKDDAYILAAHALLTP